MKFANLSSLYWLFLIFPLILLYLLKFRRKRYIIPSILLWLSVSKDLKSNSFYIKLKKHLLLFLQILLIILAVLTLAEPYIQTKETNFKNIIIIIDSSASMLSNDIKNTRFDNAKKYILNQIDNLVKPNKIMIIAAANNYLKYQNLSGDKFLLKKFVTDLKCKLLKANINNALKFAENKKYKINKTILLTDGNIPNIKSLPKNIAVKIFGKSNSNCGIVEYSIKKTKKYLSSFVSLKNFSDDSKNIELNLLHNNELIENYSLTLKPKEEKAISTRIFFKTGILHYSLKTEQDYFKFDNDIFINLENDDKKNVYLITSGNIFLEKVLRLNKNYNLKLLNLSDYNNNEFNENDIIIIDNIDIINLKKGNYFFINKIPENISKTKKILNNKITYINHNNKIMKNVGFENVYFNSFRYSENTPIWAENIAESFNKSVIWAGILKKQKIVFSGFDLLSSNFPLNYSFIPFIYDTVKWLSPNKTDIFNIYNGDIKKLVFYNEKIDHIIFPDNTQEKLKNKYFKFEENGVYKIVTSKSIKKYCVNFKNRFESDIKPVNINFNTKNVNTYNKNVFTNESIKKYFLIFAFLLLLIEWYLYNKFYLKK